MKSLISSRVAVSAITLLASVPMVMGPAAASGAPSAASATPAAEPADSTVVGTATVDGKTLQVTYGEVKGKLKLLPPQLQDAPFKDIFPLLLKSVITEKIISYFAEKAGTKNDPDYQKMVAECQKGVLQKLHLDKEVNALATEGRLREEYDILNKKELEKDKKDPNRVKERQKYDIGLITLTDKKKADEVLKELKKLGVSKFADVANKESMNKIPDGSLGVVSLGALPPPFREKVKDAANATIIPNVVELPMPDPSDPSKMIPTYNILMVKSKLAGPNDPLPPFEDVKGELKTAPEITSKLTKEVIKELEGKADIKLFTMDGKPLDQKADAPKADDKKAAAPAA